MGCVICSPLPAIQRIQHKFSQVVSVSSFVKFLTASNPHPLIKLGRASGKVSNAPSKPFGENWKISRGGTWVHNVLLHTSKQDAPNLGSPRTAQNCAVHAYKIQVFTGSSFFKFRFRHRPFLVLLFASFCQFVAVALSALGFGVIPNKCAGSLLAIQGHCLRGAFGTSKPCLQRL